MFTGRNLVSVATQRGVLMLPPTLFSLTYATLAVFALTSILLQAISPPPNFTSS